MGKVISFFLAFLLMTCSNDSSAQIQANSSAQIQASLLDGYYSLSVGQAFNNWSACDSTSWEGFETANGRSIVEYQCTQFNGISEERENLRTILSNPDIDSDALELTVCAEYLFEAEVGCIWEVQDYLDTLANPITFAVQFTVNQNDTYEISYIGFETSKSSFSADLNEVDEFLEVIYGDLVWSADYVDQIVSTLSRTIAPKVSMPEANGGGTYIGEVANGVPEGTGTWTTTEGLIHKGEFRNGLPNGFGVLTLTNGMIYEGNFTDDAPDGQGVMRDADGSILYEGRWVNGEPIDRDI